MGNPTLLEALEYLELLAEAKAPKLEAAAIRWHGRLGLEVGTLSLAESQVALAALAGVCAGDSEAVDLLRRVQPTAIRRIT
jgi:hypothetical protein